MLVLLFFLISRLINWSELRITHSKVPSSDLFCNQAQFGNSKICNKILILVQCVKSKNLVFSFVINIICFQKPYMIARSRRNMWYFRKNCYCVPCQLLYARLCLRLSAGWEGGKGGGRAYNKMKTCLCF